MNPSKRAISMVSKCSKSPTSYNVGKIINRNALRLFATSPGLQIDPQLTTASSETGPVPSDPKNISPTEQERKLEAQIIMSTDSRRRRAAISSSPGISFDQLPYQCFQEARLVLAEHRAEVVKQINTQRDRIARLVGQDTAISGGERQKQDRLRGMHKYLEELKIKADIHDPRVKMMFEDGLGDMNKPIYRYLADQKWREYKRPIVMQRITQMNVIPDVLPNIDPIASVELRFPGVKVQPGEFIDSRRSQFAPDVIIQVFDKGPRLVTIVVVDSDVPNEATDGFDYRCHGIFANIEISSTKGHVMLNQQESSEILPWLPPFSQKGAPYHRLSVFLLQQPDSKTLDVAALKDTTQRDGFKLRSFVDRHSLKPVGVTMFRTIWDEGTELVMNKHGIPGAEVAWKRKPSEKLPYKKKDSKRYR